MPLSPRRTLFRLFTQRCCGVWCADGARDGAMAWCGAMLLLAAAGCGQSAAPLSTTAATAVEAPATVSVVEVQRQTWADVVRIQGSLYADEQAVIAAEVAGLVEEVSPGIDLGAKVNAGDPLVRLDDVEFKLKVEEAKAQLAQAQAKLGMNPDDAEAKPNRERAAPVLEAKATLDESKRQSDRAKELYEANLITREEYEERLAAYQVAEARYRSALNSTDQQIAQLAVFQAQLALAEQQLRDAVIVAPFKGTVLRRHVAAGGYVRVGDPIVTLYKIDPLRFRGGVPERDAVRVVVGQTVRLHITGLDEPVLAKVDRTSPTLDTNSRTLLIEADVKNPQGRLRSGLFVRAEIITDPHQTALAVPESAVFDFAGVEKVWLVEGDVAKERAVETGRRQDGLVEIVRGLAPGDRIVADAETTRGGKIVTRLQRPDDRPLSE